MPVFNGILNGWCKHMYVLVLVEKTNTLFDRTGSVGLMFSLLQFYVFSCRCCMMIIMKRVSKISMNRKANKIRYNGMTMVMVDGFVPCDVCSFFFFSWLSCDGVKVLQSYKQ